MDFIFNIFTLVILTLSIALMIRIIRQEFNARFMKNSEEYYQRRRQRLFVGAASRAELKEARQRIFEALAGAFALAEGRHKVGPEDMKKARATIYGLGMRESFEALNRRLQNAWEKHVDACFAAVKNEDFENVRCGDMRDISREIILGRPVPSLDQFIVPDENEERMAA
jgi:hypothetical protein